MILAKFSKAIINTLAQQTLYSILLCGIVVVTAFLLRKNSPKLHLALWSLILLRLVLPPDLAQPLSLRNVAQMIFHLRPTLPTSEVMRFAEPNMTPAHGFLTLLPAANISVGWQEILVLVWALGVLTFFALFLKRRRRWVIVARQAAPVSTLYCQSLLKEWQSRFHIRRKVVLKISQQAKTPFTIGLWRPVIVVPVFLCKNPQAEHLQAILAHEMAHIKRLDDLWIVLQNFIQAVYFFHPAVWFTNHKIYIARECICDSMVLAERTLSRHAYGRGLITSLTSTPWSRDGGVLAAFGSPQRVVKTRITNIKKGHSMKIPLLVKIVFIAAAIFVLPMASQSKQTAEVPAPVVSPTIATESITFVNPLAEGTYKLTSTYGERVHPITKEKLFHRAVDLSVKAGTPVHAAAAGTIVKVVIEAPKGEGMGKYIDVQHSSGFMTRYTQLSQASVEEGQVVGQGEEIGQVGSSGLSTGPHLHFEIWKDGEHVNPAEYIEF